MRTTRILVLASLLAAGILAGALSLGVTACGADIQKPPPEENRQSGPVGAGGGSSPTPAPGVVTVLDAGDGGCTDLQITGTPVDENGVNGVFTPTGGDLVDGTYDLVEAQIYLGASGLGGPTGTTYQGTISLNGGIYASAIITTLSGASPVEVTQLGTLGSDGTDAGAALLLSCPTGASEDVSYSSTAGNLTIYYPAERLAFVFRQRT